MKGNAVYVAIASICGITVGYWQPRFFHLLLIFLYFLFLFIRKRSLVFYCLLTTVSFYLYMLYIDSQNHTILHHNMTDFSVRLTAPIVIDGDKLKVVGETKEREKVQIVYHIKSEQEQRDLARLTLGMVCSIKGVLESPEPPRNPYAFHYKEYLRFQHIHWLLRPQSFSLRNCHSTSLTWYETLLFMRQKGLDEIEKHFPPSTVGIVQALIYGERAEMDDSLLAGYQKLGLVHLLAISGSHVTLLVSACFNLIIRFITRETATILLFFLLPIYMIMTGASPSVVRASLMAMILLLTHYKKSMISSLDAISFTCMVMLVLQPYTLFQAGFQLSFIVSFALILSAKMIGQFSSSVVRLFFTTFIAQVSALPFLLYHFFEFSLLSFPLNIVFIPLYSFVILPLSLFALVIHYVFEPASSIFIWALEKVIVMTNQWVILLASEAPLSIVLGRPSSFLLVCYGLVILFAFTQMERKRYHSLLYVLLVIVFHAVSPYMNRYGEVILLDVGQGDCIYIELPYRKGVYLIDTGGTISFPKQPWQKRKKEWEVGQDVVIPFLKGKGIRQLDKLLITHGDYDHMGAAMEVVNKIAVKELVIGKGGTSNPLQAQLVSVAKEKHIVVKEVERGDDWRVGNVSFYVLGPAKQEVQTKDDNNRSMIVYTKLGPLSWLFTGDLEESGEQRLIHAFPHLRVDVLKVAHHGSATSTSEPFLQTIMPKFAVISVGKQNRYHHPHPDVIERLQAHHITILRTDEHGAIRYIYTKKSGTFTAMLP
jgi:competence protein ComEC